MSYREDRNPPPEPKPPTLEDLATALAATNKRVTTLMICLFALLGMIILLFVGLAKISARPPAAPVASLTSSQAARLQELNTRINQATARADSALAKAVNAEVASLNSVTLTESFGSRVDEVNKTLNGLYINGTLPPKK